MYKNIVKRNFTTGKVKIQSESVPWINSTVPEELNGRCKLLMKAQKTPKTSVE